MKKNGKRTLSAVLALILALMLAACSGGNTETADATEAGGGTEQTGAAAADGEIQYKIGVSQLAEHPALDASYEGFVAALADAGYVDGENITIDYNNAQGDPATCSTIAEKLVNGQCDLILAIATAAAQSAASATSEIPILGTAITDFEVAGLVNDSDAPGGNVSGGSDMNPIEDQIDLLTQILPDAKTIGIMYTTSEVNSLSAIEEYKIAAPEYGFEIVETGISTTADVPLAADSLLSKVDCVTNLTDNTVVASLPVILDKANKSNVAVFGSEIEQVKIGCLAAMGLDYIDLGKQTGKMAAAVLKGEKKASEMDFEVIEEAAFYGNEKVAENLGITFPEDLTSSAKELFTEITE